MSDYAVADDVLARLPSRRITAETRPSLDDVEGWLDDAQAQLDAALSAAGLVVPLTDARAVTNAKVWIVGYAEGRVRAGFAAAGGDDDNRDGQDLIDKFEKLVGPAGEIIHEPDRYYLYLIGSVASASARLRSYTTRNTSDRTIDPVFTRGEKF